MASFENLDILRGLENMTLNTARETALEIVKNSKTRKIVMNRLVHDIQKAPHAREISRIMWATYMSGTGFGTTGSAWKKHYNSI
jgi:hypothetical protein